MATTKTVTDAMTILPHSVGLDQPLAVAKELQQRHGVRHLPVQDGGNLVGVITDRDIQFALSSKEQNPIVEQWYTAEPYIVTPATPLKEVATRMAADRIGCALVAKDGALQGIFTTVDACRVLAELL